jgi:predicted outer membrane repeat protein
MAARIFLAGLLIFLFVGSAEADTTWVAGGPVFGNWNSLHSPYMIEGDVHVLWEMSLHIGPGVKVYFDGHYGLEVDSLANLSAIGAEGDSVVFTTDTIAHPLRWGGITIHGATDTVRLSYCVIENMGRDTAGASNNAVPLQSGLRLEYGPGLNIDRCAFRSNIGYGAGGAVWSAADRTVITNCNFYRNYAGRGGAVSVYFSSEIENCLFERNFSGGGGALALSCSGEPSEVKSCIFRYNYVHGFGDWYDGGGGAVAHGRGRLRLTDCTFLGNIASEMASGGAIYSGPFAYDTTGELVAQRCLFVDNFAGVDGGDISMEKGSIVNCTCIGTRTALFASIGNWRDCCIPTSPTKVINSIIAFGRQGGTVVLNEPGDSVRNCLLGGTGHPYLRLEYDTLAGRLSRTNLNGDSCDAYGNLFLDPLFADSAAGDYHLLANSPCIDAGDPSSPRDPDSTIADIGAYYYAQLDAKDRPPILYPSSLILSSFPNPFNPTTTLSFDLPSSGRVSLCVYDITGRLVETLADGVYASGTHQIIFDASNLSSGIYFARLKSSDFVKTEKLVLLK